eukprot:TRINITY_DN5694_c0_g2_i3.p1 TRINITY_DN5694_c0_g2~~TRINITY_DN5694_c0_g2_i3.p1  ORF type:complete len:198 (-),score=-22.40 TRINITY_DN5694_c0_g2_i3:28-621(-)
MYQILPKANQESLSGHYIKYLLPKIISFVMLKTNKLQVCCPTTIQYISCLVYPHKNPHTTRPRLQQQLILLNILPSQQNLLIINNSTFLLYHNKFFDNNANKITQTNNYNSIFHSLIPSNRMSIHPHYTWYCTYYYLKVNRSSNSTYPLTNTGYMRNLRTQPLPHSLWHIGKQTLLAYDRNVSHLLTRIKQTVLGTF